MKKFKVTIAPSVWEQIREQMLFIAEDSAENALAWEERFLHDIRRIGDSHGDP